MVTSVGGDGCDLLSFILRCCVSISTIGSGSGSFSFGSVNKKGFVKQKNRSNTNLLVHVVSSCASLLLGSSSKSTFTLPTLRKSLFLIPKIPFRVRHKSRIMR